MGRPDPKKMPKVRTEPFPSNRDIGAEELEQLREVIESKQLNRGGGTKAKQLEEEFAQYMGARHCTASTSGTAAIHVALGALNLEPGSEVITAPITDMGTVIPILLQNCVPVFADVEHDTLNMDPDDLKRRITDRTRAIMPVHLTGDPCEMDPIMDLAQQHKLYVIEDCSQAYGTKYHGQQVGLIGDIGTFSLQQSKHITTGDGGLTVTNDDELGERCTLFANKGWPNYGKGDRDYVMFGVNYRMTELQAAVALAQLKKLDHITTTRSARGNRLTELISDLPGITPAVVREGNVHTYWYYPLLIDQERLGCTTDEFAAALRATGIPAGAHYIGQPIFMYDLLREKRVYGTSNYPWSLQPRGQEVRYEQGECPQTEAALDDLIVLHVYEWYGEKEVEDMAAGIRAVVEACTA